MLTSKILIKTFLCDIYGCVWLMLVLRGGCWERKQITATVTAKVLEEIQCMGNTALIICMNDSAKQMRRGPSMLVWPMERQRQRNEKELWWWSSLKWYSVRLRFYPQMCLNDNFVALCFMNRPIWSRIGRQQQKFYTINDRLRCEQWELSGRATVSVWSSSNAFITPSYLSMALRNACRVN